MTRLPCKSAVSKKFRIYQASSVTGSCHSFRVTFLSFCHHELTANYPGKRHSSKTHSKVASLHFVALSTFWLLFFECFHRYHYRHAQRSSQLGMLHLLYAGQSCTAYLLSSARVEPYYENLQ